MHAAENSVTGRRIGSLDLQLFTRILYLPALDADCAFRIRYYEEHCKIVVTQHVQASQDDGHVFETTENTAFQRVYAKLHERIKSLRTYWCAPLLFTHSRT